MEEQIQTEVDNSIKRDQNFQEKETETKIEGETEAETKKQKKDKEKKLSQKITGIIILLIGLYLIFFSKNFIVQPFGYLIFIIGLFYFGASFLNFKNRKKQEPEEEREKNEEDDREDEEESDEEEEREED